MFNYPYQIQALMIPRADVLFHFLNGIELKIISFYYNINVLQRGICSPHNDTSGFIMQV